MRAGIFGRKSQSVIAAVAEGLRSLGAALVWQRPGVWSEHQAMDFDVVVTLGTRLHSARIRDLYEGLDVPVLVTDLPPIRRDGLWALWPGRVNAIPASAPADRLRLVEFGERELGDAVLVCGQKADDAAHGMTRAEIKSWFGRTLHMLREKFPDRRIVWRAHPQEPLAFEGFEQSEHETLAEALDDGIGALVTYNSTSGIEALMAGIPVYCDRSAYYAEVASGTGLPERVSKRPSRQDLEAFFARLTHCVWTLEELATPATIIETLGRCQNGEAVLQAECAA